MKVFIGKVIIVTAIMQRQQLFKSSAMPMCSFCCQFISQLLQSWPKHCTERHLSTLQDAVKRGISDADADARTHSRR